MAASKPNHAAEPLARLAPATQWALLVVGSAVAALIFEALALPAALLLGPMIAGVALRTSGGAIRVARPFYYAAQAALGCLIARAITCSTRPAGQVELSNGTPSSRPLQKAAERSRGQGKRAATRNHAQLRFSEASMARIASTGP